MIYVYWIYIERVDKYLLLSGWTKEGVDKLKERCEVLCVQPRGTRGESGGQTGKKGEHKKVTDI